MRRENAITTVVLCCMSAEAFMHEMAYLLSAAWNNARLQEVGKKLNDAISDEEKNFRERFSLLIPTGMTSADEPFAQLELLVKLRNRLVHLDHVDKFSDDESKGIEIPEPIQTLSSFGILSEIPEGAWHTWFDIIQTEELAWWSCKILRESVVKILQSYEKQFADLFEVWRPLAAMNLPIKDTFELTDETGLQLCSFLGNTGKPGNVLYERIGEDSVIYSGITLNNTSTIVAAERIINRICEREKLEPSKSSFYDLQTHLGYDKKSSEYELNEVRWSPPSEPKFSPANIENIPADTMKKFKLLIGRPAPF